MDSFKNLEKELNNTSKLDLKDEFEIVTKILFNKIVKEHNYNPIHFYINEKNLQIYLSNFENIPNDYSKKLFLTFSPEQRTNLDFNYFLEFLKNIRDSYFPVLDTLNINSDVFIFGNPIELEKILNSLLLVFNLQNNLSLEIEKIISKRICKNAVDLIFGDISKKKILENYSNYQKNLIELLDIPIFEESQMLDYLKNLRKNSVIFLLTNSPSYFYDLTQFAKIFFEKMLTNDILNSISKIYNGEKKDEIYYIISDIFLIFLNLFKFSKNYKFYNEVIFSLNLNKDYLQNFIINLNNLSLNALNDGGYFLHNEKYLLHLINILE